MGGLKVMVVQVGVVCKGMVQVGRCCRGWVVGAVGLLVVWVRGFWTFLVEGLSGLGLVGFEVLG